jgi:glycogen operon protein
MLIVVNGYHEPVEFTLPNSAGAAAWSLLIDTNRPDFEPGNDNTALAVGSKYTVIGRSLLLFALRAEEISQAEPPAPPKQARQAKRAGQPKQARQTKPESR